MKRMSDETELRNWKRADEFSSEQEAAEQNMLRHIPASISVYEITGPLFFGAADIIEQITVKAVTQCLIIRMRSVPSVDSTAMNALAGLCEYCKKHNITLILSHVNEQPMRAMKKAGLVDMIGKENFCRNINASIEHAEAIVKNSNEN